MASTAHSSTDVDLLLAQTDWLRRLAGRLVADAGAADDLAQDALVAALEHRPRTGGSAEQLRAWLGRVARNTARLQYRRLVRRRARERFTARPAAVSSTAEVVAHGAQLRAVLDAALALAEPYRSAVLLAYQEGLAAPEIAVRTGVTPAAARQRVSRGLARMRARLDAQHGGKRQRWARALAPVAVAGPARGALLGVSLMSTKALVAVAAAVSFAVLVWWWPERPAAGGMGSPVGVPDSGTLVAVEDLVDDAEETVDAPPRVRAAGSPAAGGAERPVRGRVVSSVTEFPVAGVEVVLPDSEELTARVGVAPLAVTAADGRFEVVLDDGETAGLLLQHDRHFDLHVDDVALNERGDGELVVRLTPLGTLAVRVVDAQRRPQPGVDVRYSIDLTVGSERQRWDWRRTLSAGQTDAEGAVAIDGLPVAMPIDVVAGGSWAGATLVVINPAVGHAEVEIVAPRWGRLVGRVQWPDGTPAEGVALSWHGGYTAEGNPGHATVGADGRFEFPALSQSRGVLLFDRGTASPVAAEVRAGEVTDVGVVEAARPVLVRGRVTADGAVPQRLAVLACRDGAVLAEAEVRGDRFALEVAPGPVLLMVTRGHWWDPTLPFQGQPLVSATVDAPAEGVELRLPAAGARLLATVDGIVDGTAVDVGVMAADPEQYWYGPRLLRSGAQVVTDAEVASPPVGAGEYRLYVRAGERSGYSAPVAVDSEDVDVGTVRLGTATVRGEVRDASGQPRIGLTLKLSGIDRDHRVAVTDDDGAFAFVDVESGPWQLGVEAGSTSHVEGRVLHLCAGDMVRLDLTSAPTATLAGAVVTAGDPSGVSVRLQRNGTNDIWSATTGADGRFSFGDLQPGSYRLWVRGGITLNVALRAGEVTDLRCPVGLELEDLELRDASGPRGDIDSLFVAEVPGAAGAPLLWHHAEQVDRGRWRVSLPAGRVLVQADVWGLGNNQLLLFDAVPRRDASVAVVRLPETGIALHTPGGARRLQAPPPAAYLVSLGGVEIDSSWGMPAELQQRVDASGRVLFPHVPAGARVRLEGVDAAGKWREHHVVVGAQGWTAVQW